MELSRELIKVHRPRAVPRKYPSISGIFYARQSARAAASLIGPSHVLNSRCDGLGDRYSIADIRDDPDITHRMSPMNCPTNLLGEKLAQS
jgi:hypothetical protein